MGQRQKVPIGRPRARGVAGQEVRLGSYELSHRAEPLTEAVWERLMMGLSTRNYGRAVREFTEAYGLDKSTVSERSIEASRGKLRAMMERLDGDAYCALLVDATQFAGQQMVVALGFGADGRKMFWGCGGNPPRTRPW
jgi:transposase-like protein